MWKLSKLSFMSFQWHSVFLFYWGLLCFLGFFFFCLLLPCFKLFFLRKWPKVDKLYCTSVKCDRPLISWVNFGPERANCLNRGWRFFAAWWLMRYLVWTPNPHSPHSLTAVTCKALGTSYDEEKNVLQRVGIATWVILWCLREAI